MKKLFLMIIAMSVLFAANFSYGEIIEKNNQRYFKLGDQEYVCNADNRISDESAKNILKRVRKIYDSGLDKKEDEKIVKDIWDSLHKIYSGEVYDEILFISLRYKLNRLFAYLQSPSDTDEAMYQYGQLVSIRSVDIFTWNVITVYVLDTEVKKITVSPQLYFELKKIADERKVLEFRKASEYKQEAIDTFCEEIDQLFNYWLNKADSNSYILEFQWDELLVKIPQVVLSMGESCGKDVARELAGKLLEISLKYAQTEDTKKELISFGKKESLEFVVPKTEKIIEKQLF